ncbi:MAG: DUF4276 family protein [Acidobacteriota bacterium]
MMTLVFLLEEPSAKELIQGLLPTLLGAERLDRELTVRYIIFEGRQDLEKKLTKRLRYWKTPNSRFVVLRDQDKQDCRVVKKRLVTLADDSAKERVLVRVACRELEAWVLGDWQAIANGFGKQKLAQHGRKRAHRDPDSLDRPVDQLRRYLPEYQKRDGARRVGPHLDPERNNSSSFKVFCRGVRDLVSG